MSMYITLYITLLRLTLNNVYRYFRCIILIVGLFIDPTIKQNECLQIGTYS